MSQDRAEPVTQLRQKYGELCKKYEIAVEKLRSRVAEETGVHKLASWAMQTRSTALVVLEGTAVVVANACFRALAERNGSASMWRPLEDVSRLGHAYSLLAIAIGEGARTRDDQASCSLFQREDFEQVIELRTEIVHRPMGSPSTAVVMALDVTDRVRTERELEVARQALAHQGRMRAMGELASGVAHDLNNVLGSLTLRVALLKADPSLQPGPQHQNIASMERLLKDATARVRCLQDFARRPGGRPLGSIDLGAVIREALDMVRAEVEEKTSFAGKPVRLEVLVEALPFVSGVSGAELRHMFINLFLNARDALPEGGVVSISASRAPEGAIVRIADNGKGIPEDLLTKIFEPFFTTKGAGGTGLGLSTAHDLMVELGGSISAANRPEGGAIFTLIFPMAPEERFTPLPVRSLPHAQPGHRVLVIDDDDEHLQTTKAVIELEGQDVDVAASGREALERLKAGVRYDLVLCDAGMPELNGWQVAEAIRAIDPDLRVYLLTGWGDSIAQDEPRRCHVTGILSKPVNLNRIRAILDPPRVV